MSYLLSLYISSQSHVWVLASITVTQWHHCTVYHRCHCVSPVVTRAARSTCIGLVWYLPSPTPCRWGNTCRQRSESRRPAVAVQIYQHSSPPRTGWCEMRGRGYLGKFPKLVSLYLLVAWVHVQEYSVVCLCVIPANLSLLKS